MSVAESCGLFVLGDIVILWLCVVHDLLRGLRVVTLVRAVLGSFKHVFLLCFLHFELQHFNAGFCFGGWE